MCIRDRSNSSFTIYEATRSDTASASDLGTHTMDPETDQYEGDNGGSRDVSVVYTTNAGTTRTYTSSYSWADGGFNGGGDTNGTIDVNHLFDVIRTTYTIDSNLRNTADASNIDSETATTDNGTLVHDNTNTSRVRFAGTGATIYHDTTVTGQSTAVFTRPTTVSALDTDSRQFTDNDGWNYTPTTQYKTWVIPSNAMTPFAESELGTLDNSGYSLGHDSISTSTSNCRTQDPYTFTNTSSSAVLGFIVAPSSVDPASDFTDTQFNLPLTGVTRTEVMLGHTDHQIQYYVYTFTVGANSTITFNVA